jgi:serine/threonine-protein kinase
VRRFLGEARVNARLQHPGIVPIHEVGEQHDGNGPFPYFTMKLVQGDTLAALLAGRENPARELPRFLGVFEQICQTLAYAHAQGVIHRDLKPSNVMVGGFGEVQVMDWGLAKVLDRARGKRPGDRAGDGPEESPPLAGDTGGVSGTRSGQALGTLAYMPPEQARGELGRVDERADVFGLGAMLCEILTGRPPFSGRNSEEVFARAKACDHAEALARLDGCGADDELLQLARACLAPQPEDRPRDAGAVARAMTAYQAGVEERLRRAELERAAAQERAAGERKRRKLLAGLAAASLALVVGGAGSALWLQRKEADRREALARRETELRQGVATDLQTAAALRDQARWATARQVLARTRERLGETGPADLFEQLEQATSSLELAARLDDIRQKRSVWVEGKFDTATALERYPEAFRDAGLGQVGDAEEGVAARVRDSAVKVQLVAALDDWASITPRQDDLLLRWLLGVARQADPDPAWRDRFRDPTVRKNLEALERLAQEADVEKLSPQVLEALGDVLLHAGANAVPLLTEAQRLHPDEFWLSLTLGNACQDAKKYEEAAAHFRAARALQPQSIAVRNNLGNALRKKGAQEEAIREYREAIRLDPGFAPAHQNLGVVLNAQGRHEEAIREHREAIRLDPEFAAAHSDLGVALRAQGELEEAIKEYREALRLDPKLALAHNNLGNALRAQGELEEAIREFREALRLDPKDAIAHNNLGIALNAKGEREEAIKEYREAIRLDPKYAMPHYNLGNDLAAKGEREEAVEEYREAIRLDPKYAQAHNNLGIALYAMGEREEAIKEYREALRLDPKLVEAHLNLGTALDKTGEGEEAIKEFRETSRLDPRSAAAHDSLGNALAKKGEWEEAIREFREAIRLDLKHARAHDGLGSALAEKGEREEAIRELREAIRLDPKHAPVHYNLGNALRAQGEREEAIKEYREALRLDPKLAMAHNNLGLLLKAKGELEEAIREFREAIRLGPKHAMPRFNLGIALEAKGERDEAIREYRAAIEADPQYAPAHQNLGVALYRGGESDEAIKEYRAAIRSDLRYAPAYGALGQALLAQGHFAEAKAASRRCLELLPERAPLRPVVLRQLQKCEQFLALEEKLSDVLEGKHAPADNAERLALAQMCQEHKKLYAASVRFFEDAFAADAKLAGDLRQPHRYNAACAAALAGCGQGKDADKLDDKERARLRQQAGDWLRADLALWTKKADNADPKAREAVQQQMKHWQTDADLAGVRDNDALAKLPAGEQEAWRKLWDDVSAVLKRASEPR